MKFFKEEMPNRVIRAIKTLFFLITLSISFLLVSAPVFLAAADTILPSALLSASYLSPPSLSPQSLSSYFNNYDFRYSLIDIPLISILRSIMIICVYSCCDGPKLSRGPYLLVVTTCSLLSLVFVSLKASFVFGGSTGNSGVDGGRGGGGGGGGYVRGGVEVALFVCSYVLAVGHVVAAYRTSCRERKKLLVYKIDIEAVSAYKNGLYRYEKISKEERKK
ncbi:hypothetical protein Ancab_005954 [Ancistrocladus abbreviatus]